MQAVTSLLPCAQDMATLVYQKNNHVILVGRHIDAAAFHVLSLSYIYSAQS